VTPSVTAVLGADAGELIGTPCTDLVVAEDRELFVQQLAGLRDGEDGPVQVRMRHRDGRSLHVNGTATNLTGDPAVGGIVLTVRDDTARVELEAQLTHQAFHDALTGLANRQLFSDRLEHALTQRGSTRRPLVVMFVDLDEFKNVNDSRGHGAGDQVLGVIAERALATLRDGDTIARLGGDEFAILLEDTDLGTASQVAERLLAEISRPIALEDDVLTIRASIGLAPAVPGPATGEDLLRNADVAMYLAKDRGKGTVAVYEPRLHAEALERLTLRAELQRAIRDDELVLHFQPTIELSTGRVAGFEALVRWNHPQRGLLSPAEFVPIAEQTGLIHPLGSWVLRDACRAAVSLLAGQPAGDAALTMAVNVASQQLERPDFLDEVFGVLAETGLPADRLTLEITESVLMQDVPTIVERLTALRARGVRIAIDDFGTGYSSLSYLRNLPLDVLKVDKAFIDRVATDRGDAALTEAIVAMSQSMRLTTVAEGVEDAAQAGWLTRARCSYGQGFLWSRPVPLQQARTLVLGIPPVHAPVVVPEPRLGTGAAAAQVGDAAVTEAH
jgi:diguanylate cyclase (GGDEF)-like protein/PAS domain S-box-containing protein